MLSNFLIGLMLVLIIYLIKHVRTLRRDVNTLFRLRSEDVLPADTTHEAADAEDRARRIMDEHIDRYHRR